MTRTAFGTRPVVPRAPSFDDADPTTLYETKVVEIIETESASLHAQLRRAWWWNSVLALLLVAIVVFAGGYWLGGGR